MNELSVEFNLKVGCKNACVYCPQDRYIKAYKGTVKELCLSDFKRMLTNIPLGVKIIFAGMSEPFFNKDFPDMLIHACKSGYKVRLYTTLKGFNDEIAKKLIDSDIIIDEVYFHMFKGKDFNPEEFGKNKNTFRKIKVAHSGISIISNPISRASLKEPIKTRLNSVCYKAYSNIIDVDGSIYFCCMDWDLKYKLGNIYEHSIDSEEINFKRMELIEKMKSDDENFICRHCECFDETKRK